MQDYELVELEIEEMEKNKPNLGSGGYPAIGQPGGITPLHVGGYDRGFPLPKSVKDEEEWVLAFFSSVHEVPPTPPRVRHGFVCVAFCCLLPPICAVLCCFSSWNFDQSPQHSDWSQQG